MAERDIQQRTFELARRIVRVAKALDDGRVEGVLMGQLLRSGTSIGANVEDAQGSQSRADFIAKMCIARKEARETLYWLRLLSAEEILPPARLADLIDEANQVVAILTAIIKTSQQNS
jgi:four helix bundle protein